MPRVIWSPSAAASFKQIHSFLKKHDPQAANKAASIIRSHVRTLLQHPFAGRPASDPQTGEREYIIPFGDSGYILLYSIVYQGILVRAIRHQKQAFY